MIHAAGSRPSDERLITLSKFLRDMSAAAQAHVAGRRFDQIGEIVGLDIERPGIVQHPGELRLVEEPSTSAMMARYFTASGRFRCHL